MYTAVIKSSTRQVLRHGYTDHVASGDIDLATEEQAEVTGQPIPLQGIPIEHQTIVAGQFSELTAPQKTAVQVARDIEDEASARGAVSVKRVVADTTKLPLPPPEVGLLVGVVDGGGGVPALAISSATKWAIFDSDRMIGP